MESHHIIIVLEFVERRRICAHRSQKKCFLRESLMSNFCIMIIWLKFKGHRVRSSVRIGYDGVYRELVGLKKR